MHAFKAYGREEVWLPSLTSALDGSEWSALFPITLPPGKVE
jgi:hypothetical protein